MFTHLPQLFDIQKILEMRSLASLWWPTLNSGYILYSQGDHNLHFSKRPLRRSWLTLLREKERPGRRGRYWECKFPLLYGLPWTRLFFCPEKTSSLAEQNGKCVLSSSALWNEIQGYPLYCVRLIHQLHDLSKRWHSAVELRWRLSLMIHEWEHKCITSPFNGIPWYTFCIVRSSL